MGDEASIIDHTIRTVTAYYRAGEAGLEEVENRLHEQAHERPENRFSKGEAMYLPQTVWPPFMWRYSCERCRFWDGGGPGEAGYCHIVGREDDPYGGTHIHPRGWCGFWMPPRDEPAFAWFRERFHPDGRSSVAGEYDPKRTEKRRHRQERRSAEAAAGEPPRPDGGEPDAE